MWSLSKNCYVGPEMTAAIPVLCNKKGQITKNYKFNSAFHNLLQPVLEEAHAILSVVKPTQHPNVDYVVTYYLFNTC